MITPLPAELLARVQAGERSAVREAVVFKLKEEAAEEWLNIMPNLRTLLQAAAVLLEEDIEALARHESAMLS